MKNVLLAATAAAIIGFGTIIGLASYNQAPTAWEAPDTSSARDAIPFRNANGGMFVYANLGGVAHNMQLDTGASWSTVTLPVAEVLVARRP